MITKLLILIILLVSVLITTTGKARVPAGAQTQPIALVGGTIHTLAGESITGGTILMVDGKIAAVGTGLALPDYTIIMDISGRHVYPSMIHGRTTLGLAEIGAVAVTLDLAEVGNINPNIRAEVAFHPASRHIPVAAVSGVGVAVTAPTGGIIAGMAAAMFTDGWTWEEMVLKAPVGLVVNWPAMHDATARDRALGELNEAFDNARRYRTARMADATRHPVDVRWEAMIPVLNREIPVLVNASELRQIQAAIAWAEKQQVRMVLVGGRDAAYVADQLKAEDIPVIVGPILGSPAREWEGYDRLYSLPYHLHMAGVQFAIAGEASAAYTSRLPWHAAAAVAFGLPAEMGYKAISKNLAEILGIGHLLGTIEPGKDATLLVTDGNPLEFQTTIHQVFIRGRQIDMTDHHRIQFERYQERLRQQE